MSRLRGAREYRARVRAIADVGRPIGRRWAGDASDELRDTSPRDTGRLARSFRPGVATHSHATVEGLWYGRLVDRGVGAHSITPKKKPALVFDGRAGHTIFAKRVRHPGLKGTRFIGRAVKAAFRRTPMRNTLVDAWNRAA